jgi:hypothetical protein
MSKVIQLKKGTLRQTAHALNLWIEDVANWVIIIGGEEYPPIGLSGVRSLKQFTHENLVVGARVEMYDFGQIYKRVVLGSDKYDMMEMPEEEWHVVWDEIFAPDDQDMMNPSMGQVIDGQVTSMGKWWPPNDYVQQLQLKRNFMTLKQYEAYAQEIDKMHKGAGAKTPSYVIPKPFVAVPETIN